jgi:hypothetical protein
MKSEKISTKEQHEINGEAEAVKRMNARMNEWMIKLTYETPALI